MNIYDMSKIISIKSKSGNELHLYSPHYYGMLTVKYFDVLNGFKSFKIYRVTK